MDQSINELFSVILHSEKVALDEKRKCKEVKDKIEAVRSRLEKQTETKRECIQKMEKLTDGLFHSTLGTKLMKSKEAFLTKKLTMTHNEMASDTEKFEILNTAYESSSKTFMSLVQDFSSRYGISGNGQDTRDSEAKTVIKMLGSMVDSLSNELHNIYKRNKEITDMVNRLKEIADLKQSMENQRRDYEKQFENEEYEIVKLQTQRHQLETLPDRDESFVSLNNELQQLETQKLEQTARDLQAELNQLMRSTRQKEAQKLRQQYRQWQRQRQQMLQQDIQEQQMLDKSGTNPKIAVKRTRAVGRGQDKTINKYHQQRCTD